MLRLLLQIDEPAAPSSGVISISRGEEDDWLFTVDDRERDRSDQKEGKRLRKADGRDEATDVSSDPEQDLLGPRNIVARWVQ